MNKAERIKAIESIIGEYWKNTEASTDLGDEECQVNLATAIEEAIGVDWVQVRCKLVLEREDTKRKPDYVFVKGFYPSSGVERMVKQEEQIMDLAKAISNNKEIIKIENNLGIPTKRL